MNYRSDGEMEFNGYGSFELQADLGICGCGEPELTYELVKKMLRKAYDGERLIDDADDEKRGYQYFMAYMLDDREFLEHGTSIRFAWLTEKGKALLEWLEYTTDKADEIYGG